MMGWKEVLKVADTQEIVKNVKEVPPKAQQFSQFSQFTHKGEGSSSFEERKILMERLISSVGVQYRVLFPEGPKGVVRWIKENCQDLAKRIEDLETRMDMECLAPVVSLEEFRGIVQGWVDAYCDGFGRYKAGKGQLEVRK
jgi:hypothetical protein